MASGESTTYSSGTDTTTPPDLRFIHYNDVYHVEAGSQEPIGGIARFQTLCNYYRNDPKYARQSKLLTFFSGDAFNPSLESSVTKGRHMVDPLNNIGTNVACLGNHDLDFGVEQFQYLAKQCKFPWLCANVLDLALGEGIPLAGCKSTVMLESSNGIKIGVIGIVEREWLATINTLPPRTQYQSASVTVARLAPKLRQDGAEMIAVVSHQRQPNDEKLASKLQPGMIDIILGGHDHDYAHSIDCKTGIHILRSGTDFKQLSYVEARRKPDGKGWNFEITRRDIVSTIPQELSSLEMVNKMTAGLRTKLEKPIGYTFVPLDARFTTVRTQESNLGNFVCDLLRCHYQADCCIMAAGTIRGDQVYPPGILRVKDIMNCFPFEDPCVVISCTGRQIVEALENGVYTYPALEGRFPQVSNIEFTFDPSKPAGQRCSDVKIRAQPIQADKDYKLATRDYMVRGKDGFTSLMLEGKGGTAKSIVSDEGGLLVSMILQQYFMSLKILGKWRQFGKDMDNHWKRVQTDLNQVQSVQGVGPGDVTRADKQIAPAKKPTTQEQALNDRKSRPLPVGIAQRSSDPLLGEDSRSQDINSSLNALNIDSDGGEETDIPSHHVSERELYISRKVMRKWHRLTGLHGTAGLCDEKGEEFTVSWTRGIAPRLEGRIKMIGLNI